MCAFSKRMRIVVVVNISFISQITPFTCTIGYMYTGLHDIFKHAIRSIAAYCIVMRWDMEKQCNEYLQWILYLYYDMAWLNSIQPIKHIKRHMETNTYHLQPTRHTQPLRSFWTWRTYHWTLRPVTFKLAFLAGGPPMPSTWEFSTNHGPSTESHHHKIPDSGSGVVQMAPERCQLLQVTTWSLSYLE